MDPVTALRLAQTAAPAAKKGLKAAAVITVGSLLACGGCLTVLIAPVVSPSGDSASAAPCAPQTGVVGEWTPEQTSNAAAIIQTGQAMGVPQRGWVIAVATTMQESTLRVLDHGDTAGPDSRGLFQQRDSWGPITVRMDPAGSARLFYERLVAVLGWESLPLHEAAQAVQRSAFPHHYSKWEQPASELVAQVAGVTVTVGSCAGGAVVGGFALPLPPEWVHAPTGKHHDYPAVDFPAPEGTPFYAVTGGTVSHLDGGYGLGIAVTDTAGTVWTYGHASQRLTQPGASVQPGQPLGLVGSTGRSTGNHLHLEIDTADGATRCPQALVDALATGQPVPAVEGLPAAGCSY